ncbi:LysE family transporter [Herbiconiux sp. P18]|uniref:LysE family transporter n=1 Tax=Herbiconiux liangxiaofengii TaxID=3342795 RepID=UPI0035B84E19
MDPALALVSGLAAGLALAAPLGAIGVLLIQEGVARGLRRGLAGAAAVAAVDLGYCVAAVLAGTLAGPTVSGWAPWPQVVGGSALVVLGLRGLVPGRRAAAGPPATEPPRTPSPAAPTATSSARRFALFLTLTAVNPATLIYFAALLPALDRITDSAGGSIAFVAGVGAASFCWQTALVALGAVLRRTTGPRFQRRTALVGHGVVVAFGAVLIVRAL